MAEPHNSIQYQEFESCVNSPIWIKLEIEFEFNRLLDNFEPNLLFKLMNSIESMKSLLSNKKFEFIKRVHMFVDEYKEDHLYEQILRKDVENITKLL